MNICINIYLVFSTKKTVRKYTNKQMIEILGPLVIHNFLMPLRANSIGVIVPTPIFKPNSAIPALGTINLMALRTIDIDPAFNHPVPTEIIVKPPDIVSFEISECFSHKLLVDGPRELARV